MSEKVLAKDAKAGQWYEVVCNGSRVLCCNEKTFWTPESETFGYCGDVPLIHLPDCTGWDWQAPKPEKKYRQFATRQEWWPHRDRWFRDANGAVLKGWICHVHANALFENGAAFLNDDGTDAEPFGVEVVE